MQVHNSLGQTSTLKHHIIVLCSALLFEFMICRCLVISGFIYQDNDVFSGIILTANTIFLFYYLVNSVYSSHVLLLLCISYFVRFYINLYNVSYVPLMSDMLGYHSRAVDYFRQDNITFSSMSTIAMGSIYQIFGIQRIILQMFNSTLAVISGVLIYKTLYELNINKVWVIISIAWTQFAIPLLINSCAVHREAMIVFCVTCSVRYFIKWFLYYKIGYMLNVIIFSLLAAAFHAGSIGVLAGYIVAFIFYRPKANKFRFSTRGITILIFLLSFFVLVYVKAHDFFFAKFGYYNNVYEITSMTEKEAGGSYYSVGGNINSVWQMILYTPLRVVYFFCSPMPWNWRGINDVAAFAGSSAVYIYCFYSMMSCIKGTGNKYRNLVIVLLTALVVFGLIFGWGVKNAGTAIRHRDKVISVCAVAVALCKGAGCGTKSINNTYPKE